MKELELRQIIREEIQKLEEGRVPKGFKRFFEDKLKGTGFYDDKDEINSEVTHAIDNMKHDMKQGDSLMKAFETACRDLHIETDGIESYL